ncbi:MAG: hypothetical protein AABW59_03460, partial [archaeon]
MSKFKLDQKGRTNLGILGGLILFSLIMFAMIVFAATPTVSSAKVTGANQITVIFNEAVNCLQGDFSDIKIDLGAVRNTTGVVGCGTTTVAVSFDGASTGLNSTATIDLAATITAVSDASPLVAVNDQAVTDGQAPTVSSIILADSALAVGETSLVTITFSE